MTETTCRAENNLSLYRIFLVLLLLGCTVFLLQSVTGTTRIPIKKPLAHFPTVLDEWHRESSHASSQSVVEMLGVDDYIEYNYRAPLLPLVNLYAAFYESVGTGGGYHSPKNCLPGGGWGIDAVKTVEIVPRGGRSPVKVTEMIIRNRNDYQVVVYWYQNRGRIIHSEYWEKMYQVIDAVVLGRRDGTFVRLLAPVAGNDIQKTTQVLHQFAGLAIAELDNILPGREL
jgi:EpsI family protein